MGTRGARITPAVAFCLAGSVATAALLQRNFTPAASGTAEVAHSIRTKADSTAGPSIGGCLIFPTDNIWNTPIESLPQDPHSSAYLEVMRPISRLHPDFGTNPSYGIPFLVVSPSTPRVPVDFEYHDDSDLGHYPIPANAPVEGGAHPKEEGDRHVIVVESQRCLLYELFAAKQLNDGHWKAASGVRMDLQSNALRAADKTSADAAGLPILPGLIRYDEVASGEIRHAIRFTTTRTQAAYVWPARHFASPHHDANFPPMGERFRLRSNFDASAYPAADQVIIAALKRYGMILADNGGDMYLSGVPDERWDDDALRKLSNIRASDFEAVDETSLQMLGDSARADPLAVTRR